MTVGSPFNLIDNIMEMSKWQKYLEGRGMARYLVKMADVYQDLGKEKGIDIDWGKQTT